MLHVSFWTNCEDKSETDLYVENPKLLSTKDVNECHYSCYMNIECFGYSFDDQNNECRIKTESNVTQKCTSNYCHQLDKLYKNQAELKPISLKTVYKFRVAVLFGTSLDSYFSEIVEINSRNFFLKFCYLISRLAFFFFISTSFFGRLG